MYDPDSVIILISNGQTNHSKVLNGINEDEWESIKRLFKLCTFII